MSLRTASLRSVRVRSGLVLALIIIVALVAFEMFNYSTTEYALSDLLGGLLFANIRWSTILSIAFCGIDFAGIARLFVPETSNKEPKEAWYLFAAWLLAATMNAILTWWGVSMAIVNHTVRSVTFVDSSTLTHVVPVFVAVMVLVIRILIIGTFSIAGERLFSVASDGAYRPSYTARQERPQYGMTRPAPSVNYPRPAPAPLAAARVPGRANLPRPEPTYHPVGMSAKPVDEDAPVRR